MEENAMLASQVDKLKEDQDLFDDLNNMNYKDIVTLNDLKKSFVSTENQGQGEQKPVEQDPHKVAEDVVEDVAEEVAEVKVEEITHEELDQEREEREDGKETIEVESNFNYMYGATIVVGVVAAGAIAYKYYNKK